MSVETDNDGEAKVCLGCGSTRTLEHLRSAGAVSCCPERQMLPVRNLWRAHAAFEAAAIEAANALHKGRG